MKNDFALGPGKIAAMFNVSPKMVVKWIDSGLMKSWRIPMSKHRRVSIEEIKRFAAKHGIPIASEALKGGK